MASTTPCPKHPSASGLSFEAILTSAEIANWARTEKEPRASSTRRSELKRAVHYPPIAALVRLSILDKAISAFGENYAESVSVVTGRIHSSYWVASTASGRASCTKPNLQQLPGGQAVPRAIRRCARLSCGRWRLPTRWNSRAAACELSGDAAMTKAFRGGPRSPSHHRRGYEWRVSGFEEVIDEERQRALRR